MWGKVATLIMGALITYFVVKNWNEIVHEVAKWARERNYQGIIEVICQIEKIRSGVVQVTLKFLRKKGEIEQNEPPIIIQKTINYEELPQEFRYIGTREHEMSV